jgi:hypothetical protein
MRRRGCLEWSEIRRDRRASKLGFMLQTFQIVSGCILWQCFTERTEPDAEDTHTIPGKARNLLQFGAKND